MDDQLGTKERAPRNRTITLTDKDRSCLRQRLLTPEMLPHSPEDCTILGDCFDLASRLPKRAVDLLVLDPPYNLNKRFGDNTFSRRPVNEYTDWLGSVLDALLPLVKSTGTIYICGDWHTSASIFEVASSRLRIRNRITWEREKGRGAKSNWKNSSEDIWFCTVGDEFTFNVETVKLRRKVIAPYRNGDGSPKDWAETLDGNFRDTHPSNMWTDITIPFWSMPENTDHPTQKSEKLLARLILASSNRGDLVLDPFLGSGTTSVVASKLGRRYIGIEAVEEYALLAEWRLQHAEQERGIQGYADGVFWERNTLNTINDRARRNSSASLSDDECNLLI
ncbi:MAG: site-specific DNA-methyltransferase [Alphaproteobacteria bacterium]|nr:MAG: site-specific DNA-methyltransferase [Alphaproteobacteria bacterium]